jgi:hypothetical protein
MTPETRQKRAPRHPEAVLAALAPPAEHDRGPGGTGKAVDGVRERTPPWGRDGRHGQRTADAGAGPRAGYPARYLVEHTGGDAGSPRREPEGSASFAVAAPGV